MKPVKAVLCMSVDIECPHCKHDFDLLDTPANDEGGVYKQLLPDERWNIDPEDRLNAEVACPECSEDVEIKGVIW